MLSRQRQIRNKHLFVLFFERGAFFRTTKLQRADRKHRRFLREWLETRRACDQLLVSEGYGCLPRLESDLENRLRELGLYYWRWPHA